MAPFFSLVRDLNSSTTLWCMRPRVVRFYEIPVFNNKNQVASVEIVFHDKENERVHATVKSSALRVLRTKPKEGSLYAVKDFIVVENRMKYKTTSVDVKLIFMQKTKMEEIYDETFPESLYNFISFKEIQEYKDSQLFMLFDVIGKVTGSQVHPTPTAKGKRFQFQLTDDKNNTLSCTLWDDYCNALLPYIDENPDGHVLVIIQFGRISAFSDRVNFCNTYNVTKIHVNGNSNAFSLFTEKLNLAGLDQRSITTYESGAMLALLEEFSSGQVEVKNLAEITSINERGNYWVHATIREIELSPEWCYLACKQCSKKLDPVNSIYFCNKCIRSREDGNYRYKIFVSASDESGAIRLLLWDKECFQLIGKTAGDLLKENGEAADTIPKVIEETLCNRAGIFKIQVNKGDCLKDFGAYNVLRMTDDPRVLSIYKNKYGSTGQMSGAGSEQDREQEQENETLQSLIVTGQAEFGGGKKRKKTVDKTCA